MTRPTAGRPSVGKSPGHPAKRTGVRADPSQRKTRRCRQTHGKALKVTSPGAPATRPHSHRGGSETAEAEAGGTEQVSAQVRGGRTPHAAREDEDAGPCSPVGRAAAAPGKWFRPSGRGQTPGEGTATRTDACAGACGAGRTPPLVRLLTAEPREGRGGRHCPAGGGAAITAAVGEDDASQCHAEPTEPDTGGQAQRRRRRAGPGQARPRGQEPRAVTGAGGVLETGGSPASLGAGWRWRLHSGKVPGRGGEADRVKGTK